MKQDVIKKVKFSDLDVNDPFFDSLKKDYDFEINGVVGPLLWKKVVELSKR